MANYSVQLRSSDGIDLLYPMTKAELVEGLDVNNTRLAGSNSNNKIVLYYGFKSVASKILFTTSKVGGSEVKVYDLVNEAVGEYKNVYYMKLEQNTGLINSSGNLLYQNIEYTYDENSCYKCIDTAIYNIQQIAPDTGYLCAYSLYKNNTPTGSKINIPLDYRLVNVDIKICQQDNQPVAGLKTGDKYADYKIADLEGKGIENHIYCNLVTLKYLAGAGIIIDSDNKISIDVNWLKTNLVMKDGEAGLVPSSTEDDRNKKSFLSAIGTWVQGVTFDTINND